MERKEPRPTEIEAKTSSATTTMSQRTWQPLPQNSQPAEVYTMAAFSTDTLSHQENFQQSTGGKHCTWPNLPVGLANKSCNPAPIVKIHALVSLRFECASVRMHSFT